MTAPEKIWTPANGQSIIPGGVQRWPTDVEYTRSDLCLELVAAAYEAAATYWQKRGDEGKGAPYMAPSIIRDLTPADAQAALAARDSRLREAALREAAEWVEQFAAISEPDDLKDAILALISKDKANG